MLLIFVLKIEIDYGLLILCLQLHSMDKLKGLKQNNSQISNSLRAYNTFGIDVAANLIVEVYNENDLISTLNFLKVNNSIDFKILGGGSNVLLTKSITIPVLVNKIKGFSIIEENENTLTVSVGGGENWHNFVMWAVSHNLGGLENLALIPGSVGAAPIQNIGAYGIEQKETFQYLEAINIENQRTRNIRKEECNFGYRDSVFKNELKDKYFITRVIYKLNKNSTPNITYKDVQEKLTLAGISTPNVKQVAQAIIEIRQSKLPDPEKIGNAGSFFKNPIITNEQYEQLKPNYPNISAYPNGEHHTKLAAAWLIDQCGYKGKRVGNTGSYQNQALVIVNHGNATGQEIWNYAQEVKSAVMDKFGVIIEPEVNVW